MLSRHLRTHLILAPSTSIGKSVFATGLCHASLGLGERVSYLKPIGTGSGDGDDQAHIQKFAPRVDTACLYHFDEPVSPHLAAQRAQSNAGPTGGPEFPTDQQFARAVGAHARKAVAEAGTSRSSLYIESAGGVHSPTLSGTSQLDAFRPLLPPTILVASAELGGISTTVSAYESLHLRGYDLDAVLVFREDYYRNFEYFQQFFSERGIHVGVVERPPDKLPAISDAIQMSEYYSRLGSKEGGLREVVEQLQRVHEKRIENLDSAPRRTLDKVWWPFVQHGMVKEEKDVLVIDSAHGDHFSVFKQSSKQSDQESVNLPLLEPVFDGSASWWTQCLGHSHPELTLAAAHGAGRYGHVLFPTATNMPALELSERLLSSVGKDWASRVFFSDDGSTGMEVALKMAMRATAERLSLEKAQSQELGVLGLKGSYHGDTMGVMDAADGNVFNQRVEWYKGRGFWLDTPSVGYENGKVVVRMENCEQCDAPYETTFSSLSDVYDVDARFASGDKLAKVYEDQIRAAIEAKLERDPHTQFGAIVLEPVVMGSGGFIFVDPLFQRVLIDLVRADRKLFPAGIPSGTPAVSPKDGTATWSGLPVVFDEVFVGLHRLGRVTAATFLGRETKPDLACYAKILTGGLVPMSVTLASDSIFGSFWGDKKVDALLHGHSYTAHAVGCSVANKTLDILSGMDRAGAFEQAKNSWAIAEDRPIAPSAGTESDGVWSLWSPEFLTTVSCHARVEKAQAMGTVLAIHLAPDAQAGAGYQNPLAQEFINKVSQGEKLRERDGWEFGVHARPLGNVVYLMSSLNSPPQTLRAIESAIERTLG